ncbi:MAG: hypothetical protein Q9199_002043 [Rusavskia elegans]
MSPLNNQRRPFLVKILASYVHPRCTLHTWRPVQKLQESTVETFQLSAFSPSLPAILPGQIGAEFPAIRKWFQEPWPSFDRSYLGQFGNHMIPLELTDGETKFDRAEAPFSIFLEWAERARTEIPQQRLYVAQAPLDRLPKPMRDDLPTPELVTKTGKGDLYDASIWLGVAPTYTPLHRDPNPNLYLQLAGRKTIRLLRPDAGQSVFDGVQAALGSKASSKFRGDEMMKGQEKTLLEASIWSSEPIGDGEEIKGFEATLDGGESMFIPQGWWHSVRSVGTGCTGSASLSIPRGCCMLMAEGQLVVSVKNCQSSRFPDRYLQSENEVLISRF